LLNIKLSNSFFVGIRFLIVVFWCFNALFVLGSATVEVNRSSIQESFYDKIFYIEDAKQELTISAVANESFNFQPVPFGVNFPFPSTSYWLYFDIQNTDSIQIEQILTLKNPSINNLFLYKFRNGQITDSVITGDSYPIENDAVYYLNYVYNLTLAPHEKMRIFIFLHNNSDEIFLPLTLASPRHFVEAETEGVLYRMLKTGTLLFAILAMVFIALVMRSKTSIYFVLYLLSISLYLTHAWGINRYYLHIPNLFWGVSTSSLFATLTVIFAQYFNRFFLNIPASSKLADKVIKLMLVLSYASLVMLFLPRQFSVISQGAVIVLAMLGSLATPFYSTLTLRKNPRPSLIVLISSIPIFIAVTMVFLRFFGIVQSDSLLQEFDSAVVLELVIITIGMVDQHRYSLTEAVKKLKLTGNILQKQKSELEHSNQRLTDTISEKERMQVQLLQVHKLETIGKLAGGIAHDFNNLLTPIIGYTEMALDDVDEGSDLQEDLNIVLSSAKRAKELVNQILTFSRHFKEQIQYVVIDDVIDEVVLLLQSIIPKDVSIKASHICHEKVYIYADPTQLHQIFMNICTNAFHALNNDAGKIRVINKLVTIEENSENSLKLNLQAGSYCCVDIRDNGSGMDTETAKKIFDPFFTTKEVGKGTGLGLSVVHGIVKKLGGAIEVKSTIGEGSVFSVYLPVSDKEEDIETDDVPDQSIIQANEDMIVLVDDEEKILQVLKRILERKNLQVVAFSKPVEAYEFCQSNLSKISLVITDEIMPQMKGSELSLKIKELSPSLSVLLITGYSEKVRNDNFRDFGIDELMIKPIEPAKLISKVFELIRS